MINETVNLSISTWKLILLLMLSTIGVVCITFGLFKTPKPCQENKTDF